MTKKRKTDEPFAWLQVHKQFLLDEVRNKSYRLAISRAASPQKTAIEIGGGTGILSFFAAKAGFKRVVSVEKSSLALYSRKVAQDNQLDHQVEFIQADIFKLKNMERHDLLIHEQIGDFVWDEDMLKKVSFAKKNFLKQDGQILPYKIDFFLVPVSLPGRGKNPFFWEQPRYGISFRKFLELEEAQNESKPIIKGLRLNSKNAFLAKPKKLSTVDFYKTEKVPEKLSATFKLNSQRILTGFLGYMEVHLDPKNRFSTAPGSGVHWQQLYLSLPTGRIIPKSEVKIELFPSVHPKDWSWNVF